MTNINREFDQTIRSGRCEDQEYMLDADLHMAENIAQDERRLPMFNLRKNDSFSNSASVAKRGLLQDWF